MKGFHWSTSTGNAWIAGGERGRARIDDRSTTARVAQEVVRHASPRTPALRGLGSALAPCENTLLLGEAEDPQHTPVRESEAPPTTVKNIVPASAPMAQASPNWTQLSDGLRALISAMGSLPINVVPLRYSSMHQKPLQLHGHKLKRSIENGSIRGLRFNASNQTVELEETPIPSVREVKAPAKTTGKTTRTTKAASAKAAPSNPDSPDWARLSRDLRALTIAKGPLSLSEVGQAYKSKYNKKLDLNGHGLRASLVSRDLPGVRYNASTGQLEVDATQGGTTRATKAPAAPQPVKQRTRKETAVAKSHAAVEGQTRPDSDVGERQRSVPATDKETSAPDQSPYLLIDSQSTYDTALATLSLGGALGHTLQQVCMGSMVVVHLSGRQLGSEDGSISLIKLQVVGTMSHPPVLFDVVELSKTKNRQNLLLNELSPLFADQRSTKVVYDFSNNAIALRRQFGAGFTIGTILDLQLAFEALHGHFGADVGTVLRAFGQQISYSDAAFRSLSCEEASIMRRPIDTTTLGLAAQPVISLAKVTESAILSLSKKGQKDIVLEASQRMTEFAMSSWGQDTRRMAFRNHGSCWGGGVGRILTSFELKQAREKVGLSAPSGQALFSNATPAVIGDSDHTSALDSLKQNDGVARDPNSPHEILKLIPKEFLEEHLTESHEQNLQDLNELVLDEGRRPYATLQGRGKLFLCSVKSVVVTKEHIDMVVGRLDLEGKFAGDNRAGVPGQLHRISVMRSREGRRIFGVTLRIGRYFPGSAGLVDDLLFHVQGSPDKPERAASVIVLGKPGSGKTTVLRDICRKISEEQTVVIVDTSNEIAGDGHIPHLAAIGQSRRMMVPDKADQHNVMKEALQNHTPQTIVVDEVSNKNEARACLDIKARGVRVVASAHGDLQSLLENPELNTLVGGTTSVTLGDAMASATNAGNKVQRQRAGAPIFDTILELELGQVNKWTIVRNVDLAVDAILSGKPYKVEQRTRIPHDSGLQQADADPEGAVFLLEHAYAMERTKQYY